MSTWPFSLGRSAVSVARWRSLGHASRVAGGMTSVLLIVFLATYNLEDYPTIWFDEGSHLHVPKTLVQTGVYADRGSEGFRYYGPTQGVGPTVLLPIALAFKLAGIGLLQARAIMVIYLLVAIALFALAAYRQHGAAAAALATALLVTSPGVALLYLGRQVLGEVPALALLMAGVLLWWGAAERERGQAVRLVGAACCLGLAAITKNQVGLLLIPTIGLLWLADRVYYRHLTARFFLIPLLGVFGALGLNSLAQLAIATVGTGDPWAMPRLLREASGGAIFVFSPARVLGSLKFLLGPDIFGFWGLPAIVYSLFLARERTRAGARHAFLTIFAVVGLIWYAFGSIGWPRYAFPALAVMAILTARLLIDLARMLGHVGGGHATATHVGARRAALVVGCVLLLGFPLLETTRTLVTTGNHDARAVAAYLDTSVSPAVVIETWEPELGFLTDHAYHYPPSGWLDRAVRARWLHADARIADYDPIAVAEPAYLIVGPFGKYTGIYAPMVARLSDRRIASFGAYDIYRIP
jgi:4-amino-4-deoxy-L-arabinose transferase-like glycosyltransferase